MMIKPYENNVGLETNLTKKWWKPKDLQGWSLSKTQEDPLQTTGWYIYIYISTYMDVKFLWKIGR